MLNIHVIGKRSKYEKIGGIWIMVKLPEGELKSRAQSSCPLILSHYFSCCSKWHTKNHTNICSTKHERIDYHIINHIYNLNLIIISRVKRTLTLCANNIELAWQFYISCHKKFSTDERQINTGNTMKRMDSRIMLAFDKYINWL